MREPVESHARVNGVNLCYFEWPGEGQPVFLAHATGFHARCWDQVVARLPGRRVIAIDMRGHGRSEKVAPPYKWMFFAEDVAALERHLNLQRAVAVGHSKGGHAITVAAAREPGIFAKLLLVDPVIMPRAAYGIQRDAGPHFAAKRRNNWATVEEMIERFEGRSPYNLWDPLVLDDYCRYGLLPNPHGEGFVLACPPEIEAATYTGSAGADPYDDIARLNIPVRILRARERTENSPMDMTSSPITGELATHFANVEDVPLPQYTHFIPMEAPCLVAEHILSMLD